MLTDKIDIYLEIGKKHVFAGAVNWPGWCRGGRDESSALQALFDAAPRRAMPKSSTSRGWILHPRQM